MDHEEAIKLLRGGKLGVAEWNRRRHAREPILPPVLRTYVKPANHPFELDFDFYLTGVTRVDLNWTDLHGANLRGANLSTTDLSGANLIRANLSGVDMSHANLFNAALEEADFSRADLSNANLSRANLRGANLSGADLKWTDFRQANLVGAELSWAKCFLTSFADVDLASARGLNTVQHRGPSTISIDTLVRSKGQIPEVFLRECGVPKYLIENQKALVGSMEPIQFHSCFISYSTKDEEFAKRLHSRMREEGLRVWFAPEDMQRGKKMHEQVDEAIRVFDKLLLVLSPDSINSKWVRDEIRRARKSEILEGRKKLFPVRLMDYEDLQQWKSFYADLAEDLAEEIREYFIPDFSKWKDHDSFEAEIAGLLKDLKTEESTGVKPD